MKRTLSGFLLLFLLPASGLAQERIKFPVGVSSKVLGYGHLWAPWKLKYFERQGWMSRLYSCAELRLLCKL